MPAHFGSYLLPRSVVPGTTGAGSLETGDMMRLFPFDHAPATLFFMPDHGGNSVKGGGHPADEAVPADEEIRDAMGEMNPARGGIPGTNDPGVPGSRTFIGQDKPLEDESARAHPHSGPQTGEGSGSGGSDKGGELDKRK